MRSDHHLNLLVANEWSTSVASQVRAWTGQLKPLARARSSLLRHSDDAALTAVFETESGLETFIRGWVLLEADAFESHKHALRIDRPDITHAFSILLSDEVHLVLGGRDVFNSDYLGSSELVVEGGPDLRIAKTLAGQFVAAYASADAIYSYYEHQVSFRRDMRELDTVQMMLKYPDYYPFDQSAWIASGRKARSLMDRE